MAKKPIILDEYIKTKAGVTKKEQVKHGLMDMEESFVDEEKDFCILEDESARVKLQGPGVNVGELVTGVSAACKGRVNEKGDFIVDSKTIIGDYEDMKKCILQMIKAGYMFNMDRDRLRDAMEDITFMLCPDDDANRDRVERGLEYEDDSDDDLNKDDIIEDIGDVSKLN